MRTLTFALIFTVPALAQWLNLPTPGIPRTADGKPNLTAPLPRMPDGKPDLSGLWQPELTPYRFDVIQDIKDEGIFRPAAQALFFQRAVNLRHDNPVTHCLPAGPQAIFAAGSTRFYRIVQSPSVIALLYELGDFRQIYTDGRGLPKDPNPTWMGYSVGHWDGDTLVVETAGFNDKTWLDMVGHPHSERLRVTEKFKRADFGHMQVQVTYDDPETIDQAAHHVRWQSTMRPMGTCWNTFATKTSGIPQHLVGTAKAEAHPSPAVLDRYVGEYKFQRRGRCLAGTFSARIKS